MKVLDVSVTLDVEIWGPDGDIVLTWGHIPKGELHSWMLREGYDVDEDEITYRHVFVAEDPEGCPARGLSLCVPGSPGARPCTVSLLWH